MAASRIFDQVAIALSTLCIVHCVAVPLLIALLPVAALSLDADLHFHGLMLWLVVPTSVVGFSLGWRAHGRTEIVVGGVAGMAILAFAALWGHAEWPYWVEVLASVAGSILLGGAHWLNFREVRRCHRPA
jgi:hypothetical protein